MPNSLWLLIISFKKSFQNIDLNLMLIKPGLTISILSILVSFFFKLLSIILANSNGLVLFSLDKTIATFVEMSESNCSGGISTFIELRSFGI